MPVKHDHVVRAPTLGLVQLLPDGAIDRVFLDANQILRRVGVHVHGDAETLERLGDAGAGVTRDPDDAASGRVRWTLDAARRVVSTAPASFVQHARDPSLSLRVGGGAPTVFTPVYGPPNVIDDHGVRRTATMADYESLVRMADAAPAIGNTGHMLCVPDDIAEVDRPMAMARAHLTLSAKPFLGSTADEQSTRRVIETVLESTMGVVAASERVADGCCLLHLCNSIPPLTWRSRMLGVVRASASTGQGCLVASFQMLGAMGPVAVLGALSQGLVEVVVGAALTQLYRPGAPVVVGIYAMPFDMRSMLPRFGDPISWSVQSGSVQIARRLGLPALGYGGTTSSKVDDAQSGAESAMATRMAIDVGADFVLHAAGWLENGRTTGFAKFRREALALADVARTAGSIV
ncbi:MAG: putative rane protein [Ilumatobacteraceae bacterium]|nr:putative rane protein [Ilumatobacteraceae bacterium]